MIGLVSVRCCDVSVMMLVRVVLLLFVWVGCGDERRVMLSVVIVRLV